MRIWGWGIIATLLFGFSSNSVEVGKATYYASAFQGRKTSSGEVFNQKLLTGAHKSLPFGTIVSVKNMANDSVVVVKINDRLPQRSAFVIDLSLLAAKQLNFVRQGIAKVEISIINSSLE